MSAPCPVPAPAPASATIFVHPSINTPAAVRHLEAMTGHQVIIRNLQPVLVSRSQEAQP